MDGLMNCVVHEGVAVGICVMLQQSTIVYAGPIRQAPSTAGMLVLLNPDDFDKLKAVVDRGKH